MFLRKVLLAAHRRVIGRAREIESSEKVGNRKFADEQEREREREGEGEGETSDVEAAASVRDSYLRRSWRAPKYREVKR